MSDEEKRRRGRPAGSTDPKRDAELLEAVAAGESLTAIGRRLGLCRQRVAQLIARARAAAASTD